MSDEIPFKFIRYQSVRHSVFDILEDDFLSSHECAKRLNNCMRAIGKKDDEIERLATENEQLKKELKHFCNIITLTKAIELLDTIYDKYLYASPSDTIAEAKRKGIKECMDTLENYLEDLDV